MIGEAELEVGFGKMGVILATNDRELGSSLRGAAALPSFEACAGCWLLDNASSLRVSASICRCCCSTCNFN